ncbi:hypothetical protein MTQ01_24520 [Streptomyces sp. XM4193]|uniref:hypothetical protein n=1 Tax=Streptomyces sp. XM4193 TaxID=2929782 RepID=UPI001FFA3B73|nr:hypothetical protein [Streptomyces sp. XM4193]MCK1799135.1 hypothetical protein [Streptomyces sp. XM4193]
MNEVFTVDFDGNSTPDVDDIIYAGLDDMRHLQRVPLLTEILNNRSAPIYDRYLACLTLVTWGETAGYEALKSAATSVPKTGWTEVSIDRHFSVNDTYGHFLTALDDSSEISEYKGNEIPRISALRALIETADREYLGTKLGYIPGPEDAARSINEIRNTILRGADALTSQGEPSFDLSTQLVDLASTIASTHGIISVELASRVLGITRSPRAITHAVSIAEWVDGEEGEKFGEHLLNIADTDTRELVANKLNEARKA